MINADRPLGFDPPLTAATPAQAKTPAAEPQPQPEVSALEPTDASKAHTLQTAHYSVALTGFQHLPEASVDDTFHFVFTQQDKPITSLSMVGSHVLVAADGQLIRMKLSDLEHAMSKGNLRSDSALARALVVHEAAAAAGLSAGATRAVMKSYASALTAGHSPREAQLVAMTNISTAVQVEAYVANKNGLATDVRRVAEFTKDAFDDKAAGSHLAAIRNRTLKAEVIKQHQGMLDTHLHAFTDAFATARETGDYAQAFDKLQAFFTGSAQVTDTPYWQNRPQEVLSVLQTDPGTSKQAIAPTRFAELLHVHAQPPAAKAVTLPAGSPQAAPGGFFSNLYARIVDFFKKPPDTAGTGNLAVGAAGAMHERLQSLDATACTGRLYKSPDLTMPEEPAPKVRTPRAPLSPLEARAGHRAGEMPTELAEPRIGVPKMRTEAPGAIELKIREQLNRLKEGDSFDLSGSVGLSVGVELNAIDFIPVAGEALSKAGVKAAMSAALGAGGDKTAQMTLLENGRVAMRVISEVGGGSKVGAEAGAKSFGLSAGANVAGKLGHRAIVDMTFHSVEDAAKWLASPRSHGGVTQSDAVGPTRFTAAARSETFSEISTGTETTHFVSSSQKSSLSVLPGVRTTVTTATSRTVDSDSGEAEELNYRLSTYAGTSSEGPVASEVSLTATKVQGPQGPVLGEPKVSLSLNVDKLVNLTKIGKDGDLARTIILDKMTNRMTEILAAANGDGFDIDASDVRARLDAALRTLQEQGADVMFSGDGITKQSKKGALGITLLRGDLGKLNFAMETGSDGRLRLGPPAIGVEEQTRLQFKLNLEKVLKFEATAGLGATLQRGVDASQGVRPVMARSAATSGEDVTIHSAAAGYLHAVAQTDAQGKTTLSEAAVSLKMDYDDLIKVLGETGTPQERQAAIDKVVDGLVDDLGAKAKEKGLDVPIDRAKSLDAFRQAIGVLKPEYDTLVAGKSKTNYTLPFETFAARIREKSYTPFAHKVMLDFRLEQDGSGKFALKPPLDDPATASAVEARAEYAKALQRRKEAEVPEGLDVTVDHKGYLQARLDQEGVRVPLVGLKADVDRMYALFDEVAPVVNGRQDPDHGLTKWVDEMLGQMNEVRNTARAEGQFVGKFDQEQMRQSLMKAAKSLQDLRPSVTGLSDSTRLIAVGEDMHLEVVPKTGFFESGHKLTIEFRASQAADDPTQWQLPDGRLSVREAVTAPKDPIVSPKLDVSVSHVGSFKAVTGPKGEPVPSLTLQVKAADVFRTLDMPPPPGKADAEFGINLWADAMLRTVKSQFLQPAKDDGRFLGQFDDAQMRTALVDMGRSLQARQADILGLPPTQSTTYSAPGVEVAVVPRNEKGAGHKMTLTFTAFQPTFDPNKWELPSGKLPS
jgi:hypothetical protein